MNNGGPLAILSNLPLGIGFEQVHGNDLRRAVAASGPAGRLGGGPDV